MGNSQRGFAQRHDSGEVRDHLSALDPCQRGKNGFVVGLATPKDAIAQAIRALSSYCSVSHVEILVESDSLPAPRAHDPSRLANHDGFRDSSSVSLEIDPDHDFLLHQDLLLIRQNAGLLHGHTRTIAIHLKVGADGYHIHLYRFGDIEPFGSLDVFVIRLVFTLVVGRMKDGQARTPLYEDHSDGQLTPSELRVARLAALGLNNVEIAAKIGRERSTVKAHLSNAYRKLAVRNRTELTAKLAFLP